MYDNNEAPYFKRIGTLRRCFLAASSIDAWRDEFECRIHQFTRLSLPSFPSIGWRERERREHSLVLVRKSIFQSWYWRCARLWLVKHSLRHIVLLHRWVFFFSLANIHFLVVAHTRYIHFHSQYMAYIRTHESEHWSSPVFSLSSQHHNWCSCQTENKWMWFWSFNIFSTQLSALFSAERWNRATKKMCTTEAYVCPILCLSTSM